MYFSISAHTEIGHWRNYDYRGDMQPDASRNTVCRLADESLLQRKYDGGKGKLAIYGRTERGKEVAESKSYCCLSPFRERDNNTTSTNVRDISEISIYNW